MFSGHGLGRYTYPGGRGMGCDYNIIVHLEKFSQFALKEAYLKCIFCGNSPEVAKWVIMIMFSPRAEHDHDHPVGAEVADWVIMAMFRPRAKHNHNHPLGDAATAAAARLRHRPGKTPKSAGYLYRKQIFLNGQLWVLWAPIGRNWPF